VNPDEIRAEIELRKKRATDLKLRETVWQLYDYHLRRYEELLLKDPPMVYAEVKETLTISGTSIQFRTGTTEYQLFYEERRAEESQRLGVGRAIEEEKITPAKLALAVDGLPVFEFKIRRSTRYLVDGPVWDDSMGEITRFIEGAWTVELVELLQKIKSHEKAIWNQRQLPALKQQMRRFGL